MTLSTKIFASDELGGQAPSLMHMPEIDLTTSEGRTLHAYDAGPGDAPLTVVWHHGTPNIGRPPEPLFAASKRLGIRWVGYDRPGYGGSTPNLGRTVASAAADTAAVADALDLDRFAVLGHSGGGPHALACAALLDDRMLGAVSMAGLSPYGAQGLDWFAGMAEPSAASLRAAINGREAKERYETTAPEADPGFIAADRAALAGEWSWFMDIVTAGVANGIGGLVDDDLAFVTPWGVDPAAIRAPTLVLHGTADRLVPSSHGAWLGDHIPGAELRLVEGAGHISVLEAAPAALEWLRSRM